MAQVNINIRSAQTSFKYTINQMLEVKNVMCASGDYTHIHVK